MGCAYYNVAGFDDDKQSWDTVSIHFSDILSNGDEEYIGCLCTFPYYVEEDYELDVEIVRSLALLGAAVAMVHNGVLKDFVSIPDSLPSWVLDKINRVLGIEEGVKDESDT